MGIGRQHFIDTALPALKAGTANRKQLRKQVAGLVNAAQEWLSKFDAQDSAAPGDFAASKPGQYQTFVDALPGVTVGAADPTDAVP